jgi:hypothetical protein
MPFKGLLWQNIFLLFSRLAAVSLTNAGADARFGVVCSDKYLFKFFISRRQ